MNNLLKKIGIGSLYTGGGVLGIVFAILDITIQTIGFLLPVYLSITHFIDGSIVIGILYLIIGIPLVSLAVNLFSPLIILLGFICTLYWLIGAVILGNDISFIGTFIGIWDFIFDKLLISLIIILVSTILLLQVHYWLSERKKKRQSKEVINAEYESIDE